MMTTATDNPMDETLSGSPSMMLKGAALGGTGCWLLMLIPATVHLINQYMHPMVFIFFAICIPLAGIAGMILGGITGWLTGRAMRYRTRANVNELSAAAPSTESRLVLGGTLAIITSTLVAGTTIYTRLTIEYLPIAKVESVGGSYERISGSITFDSGSLTDRELQEIVTAFNEFYWFDLSLAGTQVTGDGLQYLKQIQQTRWILVLSAEQIDENSIRHLNEMNGLQTLNIVGAPVTAERLDEIASSLPGVIVTHNGQLLP